MNVLERIEGQLRATIAKTINVPQNEIRFDIPPSLDLGDLAVPAFPFSKMLKKAPNAIAAELAQALRPNQWTTKWSAVGPYLNIFLDREAMSKAVLAEIGKAKTTYGASTDLNAERIMMEYVSPNTNKPLHLGHARNAFIGWAVSKLLKSQGAKVVKSELVNDRGIHIMKTLVAYMKWTNGKWPMANGDKFVADLYVRFEKESKSNPTLMDETQEVLRKWETGDKAVRAVWKKLRALVLAGHRQTYKRLGIDFQKHYFESDIYKQGKDLVAVGLKKGVFQKNADGSVVAPLEQFQLPDKVLMRQDGTSLYVTQDMALAVRKAKDGKLTRSIYCVGAEQDLYLRQLFAILQLLGFPWAKNLEHLSYGLVFLPEGKLKSREGTVVDADDLLNDLEQLAADELLKRYPKLSKTERLTRTKTIALAAFKFHFLLVGKESPVHFDPKASISFEGNTGPYLLYTYARAQSIVRKAKHAGRPTVPKNVNDETWAVLSAAMKFSKVLKEVTDKRDPVVLANALLSFAQTFNVFYHKVPVLDAPRDERAFRLSVVRTTAIVLKRGLQLLGISVLERM